VQFPPDTGPYIDGLEDLPPPLADRQSYRVLFAYYMRLTALNVEICMAQHLSLSALSCLWRPPQDAAARPVEPDFRAFCSIFAG
jgi:hypothetical protein